MNRLLLATLAAMTIAAPVVAATPLTPLPPQDGLKWGDCVTYYDYDQASGTVNAASATPDSVQPKPLQVTTAVPQSELPDPANWKTVCRR